MQSLQPEPAARYRNVLEALWRIVRTEGIWRPMRGLNVTATGAGPAHALYFACYEKLKKTLTDIIHAGGNSHVANGIVSSYILAPPWGGPLRKSDEELDTQVPSCCFGSHLDLSDPWPISGTLQ